MAIAKLFALHPKINLIGGSQDLIPVLGFYHLLLKLSKKQS